MQQRTHHLEQERMLPDVLYLLGHESVVKLKVVYGLVEVRVQVGILDHRP